MSNRCGLAYLFAADLLSSPCNIGKQNPQTSTISYPPPRGPTPTELDPGACLAAIPRRGIKAEWSEQWSEQ